MTESRDREINRTNKTYLVTGGAGFIGSHLVDALLRSGSRVVVLDNFNSFYNPEVKRLNVSEHLKQASYTLVEGDLLDKEKVSKVFSYGPFDAVVHLAAMAGVRPSLAQPSLYADVNVSGTQMILDHAIRTKSGRFIFGSSSSVYGHRSGEEFLETDRVDRPLSPYAATKLAGEMLCHAAHHTQNLQVVCLRFFTVYGPRQRPDLAIHKFCRLIDENQPIEIYGDGHSKRDYTYVDDIIFGIIASLDYNLSGYDIINLGHSEPVELLEMIRTIEQALGKTAKRVHKELQIGDMPYTYAGIAKAQKLLKYKPRTSFQSGIERFVQWYKQSSKVTSR